MKLAILFGSSTNEHEVSIVSASSIIKNLDKTKYNVTPIYLNKNNEFYIWKKEISKIDILEIGEYPTNLEKISHPFSFLKQFSCVFIMIHGKNGEDGILASILSFLNIPYIGNNPVASMICMDKIYTKEVLETHHIKTAPYLALMKYNQTFIIGNEEVSMAEIIQKANDVLTFPVFVKPANSGSSIGVKKVYKIQDLNQSIIDALKIDERILIEEMIVGKEVECALLETDQEIKTSVVGEIKASDDFYSFSAKYQNKESKTVIPAQISINDASKIRKLAKKIFQILNLHGYSRIDFFLTDNHEVILNEINTIPGFTEISMYPKLWEASGLSYSELLDQLIIEKAKK